MGDQRHRTVLRYKLVCHHRLSLDIESEHTQDRRVVEQKSSILGRGVDVWRNRRFEAVRLFFVVLTLLNNVAAWRGFGLGISNQPSAICNLQSLAI